MRIVIPSIAGIGFLVYCTVLTAKDPQIELFSETKIDIVDRPLGEVLEYLTDRYSVQFVRSDAVSATHPVTIEFVGRMADGLAVMLKPFMLKYELIDDRIVVMPIDEVEYDKFKRQVEKEEAEEIQREAKAIEALFKKKSLAFKKRIDQRVSEVELRGDDIVDDDLEHLKSFTHLQQLHLVDTKITDDGLRHLKDMTTVRLLWLRGNHVTDAGVVHLQQLRHLKGVDLRNTMVTETGATTLKNSNPKLQVVISTNQQNSP